MDDPLGQVAADSEQVLARERILRSGLVASRQQLASQASERVDRLRIQRDKLRERILSRVAGREEKQTYRTLCLEIATLDKLVGRYS